MLQARRALKERLRGRERVLGAWTSLAHPSIAEVFARSGVDFVGIDIEHGTASQEQAQRIIAASQAEGVPCLPRVASHNPEAIKRLCDSGADGVIVPMVCTPGEAEHLVAFTKYPPEGVRSFGVSRAQGYGLDFERYVSAWNDSSVFIVQIESADALGCVDDILALEGVDGAMVGPYDISGSLGVPGELDHPRVREAAARVIEACASHGKACGTQDTDPTDESVAAAFEAGHTFVVLASDVFLLWKWAERMNGLAGRLRSGGGG